MGLDSVELLEDIESAFDIQISNEEATSIVTVQDMHAILMEKAFGGSLTETERTGHTRQAIWDKLRAVIVESTGVHLAAIEPDVEIVKGLGID